MRLFAILALSLAAVPMTFAQSSKQVFPGANPAMPFAAAVKADGLIYVSGTLGSGGDVKAQTKQVLDNISATLKTAGSSLANAASVTVYLRNPSDFAAMNEVYRGYWTKDPPARTTVMVPLLNEGLVEIAVVAVPDGGNRVVINPSEWSSSPNPYSYAVKTGDTLFMSGLIARNGKDNTPIKGDMTTQTKAVLENGAAVLKAAGFSFSDVVASRIYISDQAAFQDMNKVYQTYFPVDPPARATVKAQLTSPDYIVEITMVAVKASNRSAFTTPNADGTAGAKNPESQRRHPRRQSRLRVRRARQHRDQQGRRQGAGGRGDRAHRAHAEGGGLRLEGRGRRRRVSAGSHEVQRHEHVVSRGVRQGLSRPRHRRRRPDGRRCGGGDHVHGSEMNQRVRD